MVRRRNAKPGRSESATFYPLKLSSTCAILSKVLCFAQHLGMRSNGQATAGKVKRTHAAKVAGAFFVFGERTYTVACIRQYVALTVQPMTFPGNAVQRDFPGNGVVLPN